MTKEKKTASKRKAIASLGQNQLTIFDIDTTPPNSVNYRTFYIYHRQSLHYTSIAAKNIHHASNKATKEIVPLWNGITDKIVKPKKLKDWTFLSVKNFNQKMKEFAQLP